MTTLSTTATAITLPTATTVVTPNTASVIGHAAPLRFQTAPGGGLYGAVGFEALGGIANVFYASAVKWTKHANVVLAPTGRPKIAQGIALGNRHKTDEP